MKKLIAIVVILTNILGIKAQEVEMLNLNKPDENNGSPVWGMACSSTGAWM